jgi:hypothetical protein
MMNLEWAHVVIGAGSAIIGGAAGLVAGVWRVAHIEQDLRKEFSQDIAEATHELGEELRTLAGNFDETLRALRQKINDVELNTEKSFVAKPDFDDFRKEYREDMRDLKGSIAGISRRH